MTTTTTTTINTITTNATTTNAFEVSLHGATREWFRTGDRAHFPVSINGRPAAMFVDSWDGRGESLLIEEADIVDFIEGNETILNQVRVRPGAKIALGFRKGAWDGGLSNDTPMAFVTE